MHFIMDQFLLGVDHDSSFEQRLVMIENIVGLNAPRTAALESKMSMLQKRIYEIESRMDVQSVTARPAASHRGLGTLPPPEPASRQRPPTSALSFDFEALEEVEKSLSSVSLTPLATTSVSIAPAGAEPEPSLGLGRSHGSGADFRSMGGTQCHWAQH